MFSFEMHVLEWYFDSNSSDVCSWVAQWKEIRICSGKGWAFRRPQANAWTNDGRYQLRYVALQGHRSPGSNAEL